MVTFDLLRYIEEQRKLEKSDTEIQQVLHHAGWRDEDIAEAFHTQTSPEQMKQVPRPVHTEVLPRMEALVGKTWEIYKKVWKRAVGVFLLSSVLLVCFLLLFVGIGYLFTMLVHNGSTTPIPGSPAGSIATIGGVIGLVILGALAVLILLYIILWEQLAILHLIINWDKPMRIVEAYKQTKRKVAGYFWISFLSTFLIIGGYLFFLIPGMLFSIWFLFAPYAYLSENKKGMGALMQSKRYVDGFVVPLSITLFLFSLLLGVLQIIVGIPSFLLNLFAIFTHIQWLNSVVQIIGYITGSILFTPVALIFNYLLFFNLKTQKGTVTVLKTGKQQIIMILLACFGFILGGILLAGMLMLMSTYSGIQKQQDVYNRAYQLTPTPIPSAQTQHEQSGSVSTESKCVKSPVYTGDTCVGYRLLIPGLETKCYSLTDCREAEKHPDQALSVTPTPTSIFSRPTILPIAPQGQ